MEPVTSKGTLLIQDPSLNEIKLVKEIKNFTSNDIDKLAPSLLQKLLKGTTLALSDLDFLSINTDFFEKIKKPSEIRGLNERTIKKIVNELDLEPNEIKLKSPEIAGNEVKCGKIDGGTKKIIETLQLDIIPDLILDISTYSSGITSNTKEKIGLLTGLGMEIIDALARGHGEIDTIRGLVSPLPNDGGKVYEEEMNEFVLKFSELVDIFRVPSGTDSVGKVPVNVEKSFDNDVKLFGCDVGENGDKLHKVTLIGRNAASYGTATLKAMINEALARLIGKVVKKFYDQDLVSTNSVVCVSSRNGFSKNTIESVSKHLKEIGYGRIGENLLFLNNPSSFGFFRKPFASF